MNPQGVSGENFKSTIIDKQFVIKLSHPALTFVAIIFFMNTIIHVAFRIIVFRLIYKKGPLKDNPINVLILIDELQKLTSQLIVQPLVMLVLYEPHIGSKYGQNGCLLLHILVLASCHSICAGFCGGFAIACLRLDNTYCFHQSLDWK